MEGFCSLRVWMAISVHASTECPIHKKMPRVPHLTLIPFNCYLLITFLPAIDMLRKKRRRSKGRESGEKWSSVK